LAQKAELDKIPLRMPRRSRRTTKLYDRASGAVTLDKIERILIGLAHGKRLMKESILLNSNDLKEKGLQ
jgi:hypothetical protein